MTDYASRSTSPPLNGAVMLDQKLPGWTDLVTLCEAQTISALHLLLDENSTER